MTKQKPQKPGKIHNSEGDDPTFDMYHLFSRWDFWLLVIFVLLTLILTMLILFSGDHVA